MCISIRDTRMCIYVHVCAKRNITGERYNLMTTIIIPDQRMNTIKFHYHPVGGPKTFVFFLKSTNALAHYRHGNNVFALTYRSLTK